jgi:phosphopantothenoylcysteine decarboxylase / phosphopantothenate---cysteine ligase
MNFYEKMIVIGITGGIAAYRACDLIRELYRLGAKRVSCVMTPSAQAFITPLTLEALSREPVYQSELSMDFSTPSGGTPTHISLAQQADAFLIFPATVDTIARLANGMANDPVTTTAITFTGKPVLLAPAMNTRMWQHSLTQANLERLRTVAGYTIISPVVGHLACGETGEGHLAGQDQVLRTLYQALHPQTGLYHGVRALVSAGGTEEAIDPVRVLTNRSSGKMGLAIADELSAMGAEVTLVTTKPTIRDYDVIQVTTAIQMKEALESKFPHTELLIMAAAVADFTPKSPSTEKLKREKLSAFYIDLVPNPDILAGLAEQKRTNQFIVGFAAESEMLSVNATEKLRRKKLDAIVANDISQPEIGFDSNENEVTIFFSSGESKLIPRAPKSDIAHQILMELASCREPV